MSPRVFASCVATLLCFAATGRAEQPTAFQCLAASYPDWVSGFRSDDGRPVRVLRDGSAVAGGGGSEHKTAAEPIDNPDLADMFAISYPAGAEVRAPLTDEDPGRARVTALFDGLYGNKAREVEAALE